MTNYPPEKSGSFTAFSSARDEGQQHPEDMNSGGHAKAQAQRVGANATPSEMPGATEDVLARSRACSTTDERKVLALETIADQLRLIVALLTPPEIPDGAGESATGNGAIRRAKGVWENEGGSLASDP